MNAAVNSNENTQRYRTVVQHLNMEFANNMRLYGYKFPVGTGYGAEDAV
jgi:hypothetical protein